MRVKLGVLHLIIDWRNSSAGSSILYDRKFVALLLSHIIGDENIRNGLYNKKQLNFIKGICGDMLSYVFVISNLISFNQTAAFRLRVGANQIRMSRFDDYIEWRINKLSNSN